MQHIYYELRTNVCRWSQHKIEDGAYRSLRKYPGHIQNIWEISHNAQAVTLPLSQSPDHAIELEPGYDLPYGQIYNLSEFKLKR